MLGIFKNTLLEPQKQFISFKGKRTRWQQVFRERTTQACLIVILVHPLRHLCIYHISSSSAVSCGQSFWIQGGIFPTNVLYPLRVFKSMNVSISALFPLAFFPLLYIPVSHTSGVGTCYLPSGHLSPSPTDTSAPMQLLPFFKIFCLYLELCSIPCV